MKHRLFAIALMLSVFNFAFSQAPMGHYGEYQYAYSFDKGGNVIEINTFQRIQPSVVTTNFFGFTQSEAFYMYMAVAGVWNNSSTYEWAGFRNGWYVYTFRMGAQYSYFLISRDYEQIRIQNDYQNGITNVYKRCNPNEKMDNAPTY